MQLEHCFVEDIPEMLEGGIFYASLQHRTTIHKCCCGCGNEVVLPLDPAEWQLTFDGEAVTMHPSVGNWNFPCRSHYWIRRGQIRWAEQWSDERVAAGRAHEHRRRTARLPDGQELAQGNTASKNASEQVIPSEGIVARLCAIWRKLFE